jgi:hypothetical protein
LTAFLKSRKDGTQGQNLLDLSKPNPEVMGKWARRSPEEEKSWERSPARKSEYDAITNQLRSFAGQRDPTVNVIPTPQRNIPQRSSFNSATSSGQAAAPRFNSTPEISTRVLPNIPSQQSQQIPVTSVRQGPAVTPVTDSPLQTAPPLSRYAEVVKSRKSAADIEDDLFAGIKSEISTPEPTISQAQLSPQSSIDTLLTSFGQDSRSSSAGTSLGTKTTTSYTKATQPFRVSERSVRDTMEAAKRSEEQKGTTGIYPAPDRPLPQFGFMAARTRPGSLSFETDSPVPSMVAEQPELPGDMKRVSSSEWHSSSREQWSYEIDTKEAQIEAAEAQAAEAQALVDSVKLESSLTPEQLKIKRRKEVFALRRKAKGKKFLVNMQDLGLWEEEKTKVEALADIKVEKNLFIPASISVVNFADLLKIPLETLQKKMELLGLEPEQCAYDHGAIPCEGG